MLQRADRAKEKKLEWERPWERIKMALCVTLEQLDLDYNSEFLNDYRQIIW